MYPRLLQLGSIAIPTFGAFTAVAIVAALLVARITARRLGIDPEKVWDLGVTVVLTALLAPRLLLIFTNWKDFVAHPFWLIGVVNVRSPAAAFGGVAVAVLVAWAFILLTRLPFRRTLDALAPSFALGFAIFNFGPFVAGSNFGTITTVPWAITYNRRLASLWYGTPLGTALHPVQLYAAMMEVCILALLATAVRKRARWIAGKGQLMGTWLFLHGLGAFFLDFLRGDLPGSLLLLPESVAAALVLAGGVLWLL